MTTLYRLLNSVQWILYIYNILLHQGERDKYSELAGEGAVKYILETTASSPTIKYTLRLFTVTGKISLALNDQ